MILSDINFDTTWKIQNQIERWVIYPFLRGIFAWNRIPWENNWKIYGLPLILKHRRSRMYFGQGLSLRSTLRSNPLGANHKVILCTWEAGAVIQVGQAFAMTGGVICAAQAITIGDRVTVGANTTIIDTDFHPLQSASRRAEPNAGKTAPVVIEDDVFIGMDCLVLKGVHIGQGSVIGAGSVVTKDVPPGVVVAGNPAQVIGQVDLTGISE
jgi:acetyltransferase-like isoleucine patch superfamily enzyme